MLTEAQLLPGALQKNAGLKFLCETVELRVETDRRPCSPTRPRSGSVLRIPINHFEGNYVCDAGDARASCAPTTASSCATSTTRTAASTTSPGICNEGRNVVGLMPHPERASDAILGSADGVVLLRSLLAAAGARVGGVSRRVEYTFGDSDLARERLALVADTFAAPTRALSPTCRRRSAAYVVDLGCGPGHTTALLRDAFPLAQITGLDASAAMVDEARASRAERVVRGRRRDRSRCGSRPTSCTPASCSGTCPTRDAALATWATSLRPGSGLLVCEEPVRYRSDDPLFARYEEIGHRGRRRDAARRSGPRRPRRTTRRAANACSTASSSIPVPAARAAAMFWRNAVQWRDRTSPTATALIEHFRALRAAGHDDETVMWETASGRVQEAAAGDAGLLQTSGGTPNSRHAP